MTEGVNAKFGNSLNATTAGKSLTFADGSYHISSNGDNGSTAVKGWEIVNIGGKDGTADVSLAGDLNLGSDDKPFKSATGQLWIPPKLKILPSPVLSSMPAT